MAGLHEMLLLTQGCGHGLTAPHTPWLPQPSSPMSAGQMWLSQGLIGPKENAGDEAAPLSVSGARGERAEGSSTSLRLLLLQ